MEHRDQGVLPAEAQLKLFDQAIPAARRQLGSGFGNPGGDSAQKHFGWRRVGTTLSPNFFQTEFHAVPLPDGLAGARS